MIRRDVLYCGLALTLIVLFGAAATMSLALYERTMRLAVLAGEAAVLPPRTATLLFVGDVMLGRGVAMEIDQHGDVRFPFLNAASALRTADFVFGNLEGPISSRGVDQGSIYSFRFAPSVAAGLRYAGFTALSLANNHILDWGRDALRDTVALLAENGIHAAGAGDAAAANAPYEANIRGTRISLFAYTTLYPTWFSASTNTLGVSRFVMPEIEESIAERAARGDIVIVSLHWGEEYAPRATEEQRRIAHALIDAGAALVVGHHPHAVEEVERYHGGWIAYSLGNFVFDQGFSLETMRGLMLKVTAQNGRISGVAQIPVALNASFQPSVSAETAEGIQ